MKIIMQKDACDISEVGDFKFLVKLSGHGNIDYGQNPYEEVCAGMVAYCHDLNECSRACREFINENDLGGGQWTGGDIYRADDQVVVARVSYNGRVWALDGSEIRLNDEACGMSPS